VSIQSLNFDEGMSGGIGVEASKMTDPTGYLHPPVGEPARQDVRMSDFGLCCCSSVCAMIIIEDV
jgi:hypothetical protein